MEPSQAENMSDLYKIAAARGYKKGWSYYQGKMMGLI